MVDPVVRNAAVFPWRMFTMAPGKRGNRSRGELPDARQAAAAAIAGKRRKRYAGVILGRKKPFMPSKLDLELDYVDEWLSCRIASRPGGRYETGHKDCGREEKEHAHTITQLQRWTAPAEHTA